MTSEAYVKSRYPKAVMVRIKWDRKSTYRVYAWVGGPILSEVRFTPSSAWVSAALEIRSRPQPARAKEGGGE